MGGKEIVGKAIADRIANGDQIGVGTGSTVDAALVAIGNRVSEEGLDLLVVPTSLETAWRCEELGLNVLFPGCRKELAWGFDGADAVDRRLRAIKGKGGAMLLEKVVAARCKEYFLVVDESKLADNIAEKAPVPVEVIPDGVQIAERELKALGATDVSLRQAYSKHGPVITEGANIILDAAFAEIPDTLERDIKSIVGVVECGLFLNYATEVWIGGDSGVQKILKD